MPVATPSADFQYPTLRIVLCNPLTAAGVGPRNTGFQYPTLRIVLCNLDAELAPAAAQDAFSILPYGSFSATGVHWVHKVLKVHSFSILPYGSFSAT